MPPELMVALFVLNASLFGGAFFFVRHLLADQAAQRTSWDAERARLLDRIMSRDYPEFRAFEPPKSTSTAKSLLSDADEARIEEERYQVPADLSDKDRAFIEELRAGR